MSNLKIIMFHSKNVILFPILGYSLVFKLVCYTNIGLVKQCPKNMFITFLGNIVFLIKQKIVGMRKQIHQVIF